MAVALIVAAGRGERLGLGSPKALVPLCGQPMLSWSVDTLRSLPVVDEIVVALPADALHAAPDGLTAVAGGVQRSHSVRAALAAADPAADPVIVHDAARPLTSGDVFARALDALERAPEAHAVIAATPVSDTIKQVASDGRSVSATLDRSTLWAVQTPQVFRRAALQRALADADDELLAQATDDAWLIERAGGVVHVIASDPGNLKVTTAADLRLAELMLRERLSA